MAGYFRFIFALILICCDNPSDASRNYDKQFRTIPWCVTGVDEPEFHKYPLSEFQHFLSFTNQQFVLKQFNYNLTFSNVKLEGFKEVGEEGILYNIAHVSFKAEDQLGSISKLEGVIIQTLYDPHGVGIPTASFLHPDHELHCNDCQHAKGIPIGCKNSPWTEVMHPTVLVFHYKMSGDEAVEQVHGSMRWFTPPCHLTTEFKFLILAIHSFQRRQFSVFLTQEVFEFPQPPRKVEGINPNIPSPIFTDLVHSCELENTGELPVTIYLRDFDFSLEYDRCIHKKDIVLNQQCSAPNVVKEKDFYPPARCLQYDNYYKSRVRFGCGERCRQAPEENIYVHEAKYLKATLKTTNFKSSHATFNLLGYFFFIPLAIIVARYYKEVFNQSVIKGHFLWHWFHVALSLAGVTSAYYGSFHSSLTGNHYHSMLGTLALTFLIMSLLTGWVHHRNRCVNNGLLYLHSLLSYIAWIIGCVLLLFSSKTFHHTATITVGILTHVAMYLSLLIYIRHMDARMELRPKRKFIPTLESVLSDLPYPGFKILTYAFWTHFFILLIMSLVLNLVE